MLSLVLALSASAVAFTAWRWWRPTPTVSAKIRSIKDVDLNWRCDAGHSFIAKGEAGDRQCGSCSQPAYAVTLFQCPQHGATEVAARFAAGADGVPRVSQYRVHEGIWSPATESVRCPQCGAPMFRKQADPLDALSRGKKKGG